MWAGFVAVLGLPMPNGGAVLAVYACLTTLAREKGRKRHAQTQESSSSRGGARDAGHRCLGRRRGARAPVLTAEVGCTSQDGDYAWLARLRELPEAHRCSRNSPTARRPNST